MSERVKAVPFVGTVSADKWAPCPGLDRLIAQWEREGLCAECLRPCELHRHRHCATCHKHTGECGYGSCQDRATTKLVFHNEVRRFCDRHATHPYFSFARRDVIRTEPV